MTEAVVDDRGSMLLERSAELTGIAGLVTDLLAGTGRVAVVEGPPGIGKTSLVAALKLSAGHHGLRLLSTRGTELAKDVSFGAIGTLLAGVPGSTDAEPERAPDTTRTGDFAMLRILFESVVRAAGDAGLVLIVDDCHWLDSPSLRFLAFLAAKIRETRVLLFLTTRPDTGPGRQSILDEIIGSPDTLVLRPKPLSRAGSDEVLAGLFAARPDAAFAAVCFRETGGNPLVLGELAAAATADRIAPVVENTSLVARIGARAVHHRVSRQLSTLTQAQILVINAVAILGDGARLVELSELVGAHVDVPDGVAALVNAGLVRGRPDVGVEFVHPLVRAAVYESIDPATRMEGHRRAAELLASAHVGVESVAAHYIADSRLPAEDHADEPTSNGRNNSPTELLARAAAEAMRRGSPDSALRYLRRGLATASDGPDRSEMLLAAADAAFQVDLPSAVDYLRQLLPDHRDPDEHVQLAGTLVAALLLTGRIDEGLEVIRQEQDSLPLPPGPASKSPDPQADSYLDIRTYLDSLTAMIAVNNPALPGLEDELNRLLERAPTDGPGGRSLDGVLALYQASRAEPEAVGRALRAISDGVRITGEAGRRGPVPIAVNVLLLADRPEGLPALDRAVLRSRDEGSLLAASGAYAYRAHGRLLRGELTGAYSDARTARWSTSVLGLRNKSFVAAVMANTCLAMGRFDEAADVLSWSELASAPTDRPFTYFALCAFAALHRLSDRPDEGLRYALLAGDRYTAGGGINPAQVPWRSEAALCHWQLGEQEQAMRFADQEFAIATQWGAPRASGRALRVLAQLNGGPRGRQLLDKAVGLLRPSIARLELAECLLARAGVTPGGDRTQRTADLTDALLLAQECGAVPLTDRARSMLDLDPPST